MATKKTSKKKTTTTKKKATTKTTKKAAKKTTATKTKAASKKSTAAATKKETAKKKTATTPAKETKTKEKKPRGRRRGSCQEDNCSLPVLADTYCRAHYIKNWAYIIDERKQKARRNLNKYIESIAEKYPNQFMNKIRDDLTDESSFRTRLKEFGFKEEYETSESNPFTKENFDELVHALKFED